MFGELSRLHEEIERRHELLLEAVGAALGEVSNKTLDRAEKAIREMQDELFTSVERRLAELVARFDAIASGASSRSKDFKFSNERHSDDIVDLPNPLSPRNRSLN